MVLGGASTAVAALQEAPFACFEDDEIDATLVTSPFQQNHHVHANANSKGLPTHAVVMPGGTKALPARSIARLRTLECTGAGTFYFQNDALKHRFICWRVTKNVLVLREWSLHASLDGNGLRLELPATIVPSGVAAFESWDANAVVVSVLTHAGTIHRFTFAIKLLDRKRETMDKPAKATDKTAEVPSIFKQPDNANSASVVFAREPPFTTATDVVGSLQADEAITTALWVNEYNLIVATDIGRMIGVNFGLPASPERVPQEFLFSDESMVQWLWNGLVKSSHRKRGDDISPDAVVGMTFFPLENDQDGDHAENEVNDVCILTLSADFALRAWSFRNQTCLGKQMIRSFVRLTDPDDDDELDDDSKAYVTNAKLVAIPSSSSGACRILVHVESTEEYPQQIVLLRGDIDPGVSSSELSLEVGRVFSIGSETHRLKFVDFAVERGFLYSAWRSSNGDFVYSHANPMGLTGPRVITAQLVSSIDVQMKKYDQEDGVLPFLPADNESSQALIDNFFAERVLLPGRFSRQSVYKAIAEYHGSVDAPLRAYFTQIGPQESRYKELLIGVVTDKWVSSLSGNGRVQSVSSQRISIWRSIIDLCTKHWRNEIAPIGFATIPGNGVKMLGSPVLLRRNRVSLFFPSASSIATTMLSKPLSSEASSTSQDVLRDIVSEVLPAFDAFPSNTFQVAVQNEVTAVMTGEDWKMESLVALARQSVRLALKRTASPAHVNGLGQEMPPDVVLARCLLRLSQLLGHNSSHHERMLQDLVDSLAPPNVTSSESTDDPFAVHSDPEEGDENEQDDDQMNGHSIQPPLRYFGGNEICYSFSQVAARTVDELCSHALRVVLCLAHIVDAKLSFVEPRTVRMIERVILPKAIVVYQRWSQSRWLATQNITSTTEIDALSAKTSGTLLPPLLQFFLAEANENLNRFEAFQRARSVGDDGEFDSTEDPHELLGSFASGILELVSRPNDLLVAFLQKKREYSILRSMLSCSLNDISLLEETDIPLKAQIRVKYIRSIGECLAWEGYQVAKNTDVQNAATEYFKQAIRCFNMCLSSYVSQVDACEDDENAARAVDNCERFVGTAVRLLKETVPRGYYSLTLDFLWVIASEALDYVDSKALQSFVWVNIFKYAVEDRAYHDAHLALMRTVQLSSLTQTFVIKSSTGIKEPDGSESQDDDIARSAVECTNYFVKELCRHGRLDLVCDFQWGILESEVEQQILWLAANAGVAKEGCVDPSVVMHHQLVYAFFARRNQPANAAAAMHGLYLRLRLASTLTSAQSLRTQRNALLAAMNVLLEVTDEENRWVVRKLHAEELLGSEERAKATAQQLAMLNIVTYKDMERDLAVLEGKLRLLDVGHEESVLLSTMDASDAVMLLVDSALRGSLGDSSGGIATLSEKKQESLTSLELAVQIASKNALSYAHMTKSLARFCVSNVHSYGVDHLAWELLKTYLRFVDDLAQYEIAAEEILSWQVKIVLPEWIVQRISCSRTGNAAKLVRLYVNQGLLIEAVNAAAAMIPLEIMREGEAAFRKRSNATWASLPWLPYNLFDTVLNAADAALTTAPAGSSGFGFRGAMATAGDPVLRSAAQDLRNRLVDYFKYINTLEQARQAAGLARDSFAAL